MFTIDMNAMHLDDMIQLQKLMPMVQFTSFVGSRSFVWDVILRIQLYCIHYL